MKSPAPTILLPALAALLSAGCATAPTQEAALAGGADTEVICEMIAVTGSHRKERVCYTQADKTAAETEQQAQTEEEMRRAREQYNDVNTPLVGGFGG